MFKAILIILFLGLSYLVGRVALSAMGVIMIDSLAGLIFKPMIWGFFILTFGLGIILWLFKMLFVLLGYIIGFLFSCIPLVLIVLLVIALVKSIRNKRR